MQVRDPEALAKAMAYAGFSVRTLAEKVGVSRAAIGHLRSGKRATCADDVAKRIAEAVDMPLPFMFVPSPVNDTQAVKSAAWPAP